MINKAGKEILKILQDRFYIHYLIYTPDNLLEGFEEKPKYDDLIDHCWLEPDGAFGVSLNQNYFENIILDNNLPFEPSDVVIRLPTNNQPFPISELL